jgi:RNA polymerase sigma factor (sigma-70 family)
MDISRTLDSVWKLESARIIAALTRVVHDVGRAEELAQDALVAALEQWPTDGMPDNPGAWLMTAAKRRAVDDIRRSHRLVQKQEQLAHELSLREAQHEPEPDDVLRLMFLACHPVLPSPARVALTLRLVAGLTNQEIARAFLVPEAEIVQRIAAAKEALAELKVPFELPSGSGLTERLSSVLEVVYLIFNEGYSATSGENLIRADLCLEALRLGRMLAELTPDESEVHGLVALMEIQASRSAARTGPTGEPIPLEEQNRGRWDPLLIRRGFAAMLRARELGGAAGPYLLQAAIAVCHAQARAAADTDWAQIATLYGALSRLLPTPVVQLNRAVAVGRAHGPAAGLTLVDSLVDDPHLRDYHLVPSVRGDFLARLGRHDEARLEFERGAALARNATERGVPASSGGRTSGDRSCRSHPGRGGPRLPASRRPGCHDRAVVPADAAQTVPRLRRADPCVVVDRGSGGPCFRVRLGDGGGEDLEPSSVGRPLLQRMGGRRRSGRWLGAAGRDHLAAKSSAGRQLEPLWQRTDQSVRERTLWCLLYESAAPVKAVLALNVEDLDLDDRRARSGDQWVGWRSGTAALLAQLVAGRSRGPLFLADRRPGPGRPPAEADRCPDTSRRRLSYERAEYLFKQATKSVDPTGEGFTLRALKRTAALRT